MATKQLSRVEDKEMFRLQFRRTQLCSFFQQGSCRFGGSCAFAHDMVELAPDLTKTSLCKLWKRRSCPFSNSECRFAHGKNELRVTPAFTKIRGGNQKNTTNDKEVSALADAQVGKPCDCQILSSEAPPGCLVPAPFNIDISVDAPVTVPTVSDQVSVRSLTSSPPTFSARRQPPMPPLPLYEPRSYTEPMKITPSDFFNGPCNLGGSSPISFTTKLLREGVYGHWGNSEGDTEVGENSSDGDSSPWESMDASKESAAYSFLKAGNGIDRWTTTGFSSMPW